MDKFLYKSDKSYLGQVKNSRLVKFKELSDSKISNIYRARVLRYLDSMDAYIVDIGEDKNGFLKGKNTLGDLKGSDEILVEVISEPEDHKLYDLSQKISFTDHYLVLMPYVNSRSKNLDRRFEYPFKLRTRGRGLSDEEIKTRYQNLVATYKDLVKKKNFLPIPDLIYKKDHVKDFLLGGRVVSNVKVDLKDYDYDPSFNPYQDEFLSSEIEKKYQREVEFGESAYFVVEKTEALTAIDINSRAYGFNKSKEDMSFTVNLASLEELAVNISLKEIRGMVVIDFIRMKNYQHKKAVDQGLKKAFKKYGLSARFHGFTRMGLYELIVY